jgi:hypothetical protein
MPLPGGPADKLGNRYENWWTIYQLVRMLQGACASIRIENPGVDKAEFVLVLSVGGRREWHQAKRSHPSGRWKFKKGFCALVNRTHGAVRGVGVVFSDVIVDFL